MVIAELMAAGSIKYTRTYNYILILVDQFYYPSAVHHIAHVRDRITTNFPLK